MRHWLRGALGVAVAYPLIWYYSAPAPAVRSASLEGVKPPASAAGPTRSSPAPGEAEGPERHVASRSVTERLPVATGAGPATEAVLPKLPTVEDPDVPLAMMAELKPVIARAAQVQQYAHNPGALDKQVQTLDEDPAKLAKLRALAEMFMQLPPPRGDSYLPSSTGAHSSQGR